MIENEIAKLVNLRPAAVELLLVAEFGEAFSSRSALGRSDIPCLPSSVRQFTVKGVAGPTYGRLRAYSRTGRESSLDRTSWARSSSSSRRAWANRRASRQPLEGGITNRNFRARFGGTDYVIRVPGKDTSLLEIDRGAERIANERAARIGVAPPVAAMLDDPQAIVTEFVEGEGMEPADLREPATLTEVRALAARDPRARRAAADDLRLVPDRRDLRRRRAAERGGDAPGRLRRGATSSAARIEAALSGPEHEPVPCHNDLLAANFIRGAEQLWIVDWEYAGMGDRYFDLANFAVNNELGEAAELALLEAYFAEPADAAAARRRCG